MKLAVIIIYYLLLLYIISIDAYYKRLIKIDKIRINSVSDTINSNNNKEKCLFSFGVIADIQYADSDDALNFQQTKIRRYRQSLKIFEDAVDHWNQMKEENNILFSIILGDILDGKCRSLNNRDKCYNDFLQVQAKKEIDYHYCFGNHCHYSFSRKELHNNFLCENNYGEKMNAVGIPKYTTPNKLYYDFSPMKGWRFISLDSYDVSCIGASSAENKIKAHSLLSENNPNDLEISGSWFDNLPIDKYRYVPYNGGCSTRQLHWLEDVIQKSKKNEERLIIFSHQPIHAVDKPQSLNWNSEEIKSILSKGDVRAFFAGHDHDGQFDTDNKIVHIVPPAPLEVEENQKAFGFISVFNDKLVINWTGKLPSKTKTPWLQEILFT